MFRHIRRALLASAATAAALAAPAVAQADVLNDWNVIAQNQAITLRPTAHGQTRGIAMVQGAVYDAVNAIDRGHQPYLLNVQALGVQPWASADAAIATAAHHVLVKLVAPAQVAALDTAYQATLDGVPDGLVELEGVRAGEAAAAAMLAARTNDGYFDPFDFGAVIGPDPGDWRPVTPTALDPDASVGDARPFLIESPSQFRSKGPNALTSRKYAREFDEVKTLGALNSATRTADQTAAAIFWQFAPTVLYNRLTRELSAARQLDVVDEATTPRDGEPRRRGRGDQLLERQVALALLAPEGRDPGSGERRQPGHGRRPDLGAAVPRVHADDAAARDTAVPGPSVRTRLRQRVGPQHPPGVLRHRQDRLRHALGPVPGRGPRETRHFDRFSEALQEVVDARVWGGIHFRTADVQGAVIGRKVARFIRKHHFNRVR